jgi:hypothetical protein
MLRFNSLADRFQTHSRPDFSPGADRPRIWDRKGQKAESVQNVGDALAYEFGNRCGQYNSKVGKYNLWVD